VESLGGQVLDVEVSATKKLNIDRLLETIGLQSEILDLKANPNRPAEGTVIEAKLDRGRGPVATVLVQRGARRVGDLVVAGAHWARMAARRSRGRGPPRRSKSSASTARPRRATAWRSCRRRRAPAKSPPIALGSGATRWPHARPACAARSSR